MCDRVCRSGLNCDVQHSGVEPVEGGGDGVGAGESLWAAQPRGCIRATACALVSSERGGEVSMTSKGGEPGPWRLWLAREPADRQRVHERERGACRVGEVGANGRPR